MGHASALNGAKRHNLARIHSNYNSRLGCPHSRQDPRHVQQRWRRRLGCQGFTAAAQKEDLGSLSVSEKQAEQREREGLQQHLSADSRSGHHASTSGSDSSSSNGRKGPTEEDAEEEEGSKLTAYLAPAALLLGIGLLVGGGYAFKSQLRTFIDYFVEVVDTWGPLRYAAYGGVYTVLEVLALPAVPLTMTAGLLFGVGPGVAVVSVSSTAAATISFLIARYAARDKIQELASQNSKFKAVDRAIGRNSLKVVTLLRLSPLLPLALSNYLYGLTSVDLGSYVLGSWAGMLPGTIAYVAAGSYGRALLDGEGEGLSVEPWQVGAAIAFTIAALLYIGKVAKTALDEEEAEGGD